MCPKRKAAESEGEFFWSDLLILTGIHFLIATKKVRYENSEVFDFQFRSVGDRVTFGGLGLRCATTFEKVSQTCFSLTHIL